MNKLFIENVKIEQSDKAIETNIPYIFSEGFNIVSGKNEIGKTVLMHFIKNAFLSDKDSGRGIINFSVIENEIRKTYTAQYNGKNVRERNIKIFEQPDNNPNDEIRVKYINSGYINRGFFITLDDVMNLKNSNNGKSLEEIIKDPSSDYFNELMNKINEKAKSIINDKNKPGNELKIISEKIKDLNKKIDALSNKEEEYNNIIFKINAINNEITYINKKEFFIKNLKVIQDLKNKSDEKKNEYERIKINFNEKLFQNQDNFIKIIEASGKYNLLLNDLNNEKLKLEKLQEEIHNDINAINEEYSLNLTKEDTEYFSINDENLKIIKEAEEQIKDIKNKLISKKTLEEEIQKRIDEFEYEKEKYSDKTLNKEDYEIKKNTCLLISQGLSQYKNISLELEQKNNQLNKKLNQILMCIFMLFMVLFAVLSVFAIKKEDYIIGYTYIAVTLLSVFGIISLWNPKSEEELKKLKYKESVLKDIKETINKYNNQVYDGYKLIANAEYLKQDLDKQIITYENYYQTLDKIQKNYEKQTENKNEIKKEIEELNNNLEIRINQIKNIFEKENSNIKIPSEYYTDISKNIKSIQNKIKEAKEKEKTITKEIEEIEIIRNNTIEFINKCEINIPISQNIGEITEELSKYYKNNTEIYTKLKEIETEIKQYEEEINKKNQENSKFEEEINLEDIDNILNELDNEKQEKQKIKENLLGEKKNFEDIEGLNDLKSEKAIKLNQYRKKFQEFIIWKLVSKLCEKTKQFFNKNITDIDFAEKYLMYITGEKYTKIKLETKEIANKDSTIIKGWDELSRGTKEQLYLALRLGYASNYTKNRITKEQNNRPALPFIFDDTFVNFDKERTKNALKCLYEISKTNQVIYFTCHEDLINSYIEELGLNNSINKIIMK